MSRLRDFGERVPDSVWGRADALAVIAVCAPIVASAVSDDSSFTVRLQGLLVSIALASATDGLIRSRAGSTR